MRVLGRSVMSNSLQTCELEPDRLLCPWNFQARILERVPISTPGDRLNPGIEPGSLVSPALAGGFLTTSTTSVQFSSVAQLCLTLCDPMNHSTPGLPVHHQLPEFTQTHVHRVSDAIQPSHPLLSPSPPAPNPSQHQSFPMSQLFT